MSDATTIPNAVNFANSYQNLVATTKAFAADNATSQQLADAGRDFQSATTSLKANWGQSAIV